MLSAVVILAGGLAMMVPDCQIVTVGADRQDFAVPIFLEPVQSLLHVAARKEEPTLNELWTAGFVSESHQVLVGSCLPKLPMFLVLPYGVGALTLVIPLAIMTMGFGYTNVGATTFTLQSAGGNAKALALGLTRASTSLGNGLGPLFAGILVQAFGYETGFHVMAGFSGAVFLLTWLGLKRRPVGGASAADRLG